MSNTKHMEARDVAELFRRIYAEGPWESAQTHRSLIPFLQEECAELVEAIESGDAKQIRDELGDVLLQVFFHAAIASAQSDLGAGERFDFADVLRAMIEKLQRRAPYWFDSGPVPETAEEQDVIWAAGKAAENEASEAGRETGL